MIDFQILGRGIRFAQISRPEIDSRGFHPFSRAKVCPQCLEVWAIIQRAESDEDFAVESQYCDWHRGHSLSTIPGSLLDDCSSQTIDWDLLNYLPLELKQREFDLHVQALENDSHERTSNSTGTGGTGGTISVSGGERTSGRPSGHGEDPFDWDFSGHWCRNLLHSP